VNPGSLLRNLETEFFRQATQGQRMLELVESLEGQISRHAKWLARDCGVWNRIHASCDPAMSNAIAATLGLDSRAVSSRDMFMEGFSTVSTYDPTWDLALRFSTGADHTALLSIRQTENTVNVFAHKIFGDATHLYRGHSVSETVGVHNGTVSVPRNYSFVSLSSSPMVAIRFAFRNHALSPETAVVLVIDAQEARRAGIVPATYSLAASVLGLRRGDEDAGRTFPLGLAHEVQAHFPGRWPLDFGEATVAILTIVPPTPDERLKMEGTGLPILDCKDLFLRGQARQ